MVNIQAKVFIFHYKKVDFAFLRKIKFGDLAFNRVYFVVDLIL